MTNPVPPQYLLHRETAVTLTGDFLTHGEKLFPKVQFALGNINCNKEVVERICRQLVSDGIFDSKVVKNYITGNGDRNFKHLIWEFHNEEQETFLKFLDVFSNLHEYPVTRDKFRRIIKQFMTIRSSTTGTNVLINPEENVNGESRQVLCTNDIVISTQSNNESRRNTSEALENNSNEDALLDANKKGSAQTCSCPEDNSKGQEKKTFRHRKEYTANKNLAIFCCIKEININ